MPELRWILLVLGALLVAGLWWWESKRSSAKDVPPANVEPAAAGAATRQEPVFDDGDEDDEPSPGVAARADERRVPHGDPPVVTLEDLPEDVERVVLAPNAPEPRRIEPMSARRDVPGTVIPEIIAVDDDAPDELPSMRADAPPPSTTAPIRAEVPVSREVPPAPPAPPAPPVLSARPRDPAPTLRPASPPASATASSTSSNGPAAGAPGASATRAAAPVAPAAGAGSTGSRPATVAPASTGGAEARRPAARTAPAPERREEPPPEPSSPLQKIVALRLVAADGARIEGSRLRAALEAEGMRFGKYSIFHRQRADGRALYSVASLLEPGSFDVDRMGTELYPGISLFAVFPGPMDAPETFDEMLATTRRLADRLDAVPQDERGGPLGPPRALAIREELVHFQGLVNKTRRPQA